MFFTQVTERFEIESINLPINTMINDYRINRIVGYWDGSKISPDPVVNIVLSEKGEQKVSASSNMRWLVALGNVVVLASLVVLLWRPKKRAPR